MKEKHDKCARKKNKQFSWHGALKSELMACDKGGYSRLRGLLAQQESKLKYPLVLSGFVMNESADNFSLPVRG